MCPRKKQRKKRKSGCFSLTAVSAVILSALLIYKGPDLFTAHNMDVLSFHTANQKITSFAKEHNLHPDAWPDALVELMQKNPETESFVLQYPLKKDLSPAITLEEYENSQSVPLLFQWDERWGYSEYAGEMMGLSGCGPVCLSMVSIYLLQDTKYNPKYIAEFAEEHGYCVPANGSTWSLIYEGGKKLGLDVREISPDESCVKQNLEAGKPIICTMGPGDFTSTGHFIVLTSYSDGTVQVNDPNSKKRSEKLWKYNDIKNQIRNLWVCA